MPYILEDIKWKRNRKALELNGKIACCLPMAGNFLNVPENFEIRNGILWFIDPWDEKRDHPLNECPYCHQIPLMESEKEPDADE